MLKHLSHRPNVLKRRVLHSYKLQLPSLKSTEKVLERIIVTVPAEKTVDTPAPEPAEVLIEKAFIDALTVTPVVPQLFQMPPETPVMDQARLTDVKVKEEPVDPKPRRLRADFSII